MNSSKEIVDKIYTLKKQSTDLRKQNGRVTYEVLMIERQIDQLLIKYNQMANYAN